MEREYIDSTCVRSVGYDSTARELEIEFTDGTEVRLETETVYPSIGLQGIQGYIRKQ